MDESWQKQTPLNEQYKFLPEIEGPEYECELLDKKLEDDNFGIIDE